MLVRYDKYNPFPVTGWLLLCRRPRPYSFSNWDSGLEEQQLTVATVLFIVSNH